MHRVKGKFQVFTILLLTLILTFGIIIEPIKVLGAPYDFGNGTSTQEIQQAINNDLKYYNNIKIKKIDSNSSILYNLRNIIKLATWVDALKQLNKLEKSGTSVINFPTEVVNYEANKLDSLVKEFNEYYKDATDNHAAITLSSSSLENGSVVYENLITDVKNYLTTYMDSLITENSDVEELVKLHKKEVKYLYYVCTATTEITNRVNSIMPQEISEDGEQGGSLAFEYIEDTKIYVLTNDDKYKSLIQKGKELTDSDVSKITSGDPDTSKDLIELFLTGVKAQGQSITYENVSELWYLYYSIGSIYQPFSSKVGSDEFIQTLNTLTGNNIDDTSNKYYSIYQQAIKYKKPLYIMSTDKKGNPTGSAKTVTLAEFISSVEKKKESGILVLPVGKFSKGTDDNSYYYYKHNNLFTVNKNNSTSSSTDNADSENTDNANNDKTDTTEEVDYYGNAADEISDKTALSDPVFRWGVAKRNDKSTMDMGTIVMNNILQNISSIDTYKPNTALLYITVFGDIVLEDGTIILPGCANPSFYKDNQAFYPYSISFMQNYPNLSNTKTFRVTDGKAEGKILLMTEEDDVSLLGHPDDDTDDDSGSEFTATDPVTLRALSITGEKTISKVEDYLVSLSIDGNIYDIDEAPSSLFVFAKYDFSSDKFFNLDWMSNLDSWGLNRKFMRKVISGSGDNGVISLFLQDPTDLEPVQLAAIAKNFYTMCMADEDGEISTTPSSRFSKDVIAKSVVVEALNGLTNIQGYVNYRQTDYEQLVADSSSRFKVMLTGLLQDFVKPLYDITGVIGIENAYQSEVLGTVVSYGRAFMFFIMLAIVVGLLFKFMRGSYDLLQTIISGGLTLIICWSFIAVVPIALPTIFNGSLDILTAHKANDLGYLTLMMRMEDYDSTYNANTDSKGNQITNTSTINLYKFGSDDLQEIADEAGISMEVMLKGEPLILDYDSGIYIEGNVLKCSLDNLFVNNPITGDYKAVGAGKYYTLTAQKTASSMIDYYTPYHLVVDALVNRLNAFNVVFPANREFINYGGLQKDSFVMTNYITSIPFLKPESPDLIGEQYSLEIQDAATSYMGDLNDTFGLSTLFSNLNDMGRNSLWYKTIVQNGKSDEEYLQRVIDKTTRNTKQFLIDNYDRFEYMSDENIIKITSLYITVSLSRQLGSYGSDISFLEGNQIYPMFVNAEEFKLNDVLTATYISDREQFRYKSLDIIAYMADTFGIIWGTVFSASVLVSYLILNITRYVIPILYIALGLLLLFKFISESSKKEVIRGYLTGTVLIFCGYLTHCYTLILASTLVDSTFGIVLPLIINVTVLDMMIKYLLNVFRNPLDLGGRFSLASIAPWIANVTGLTSAVTHVNNAMTGAYKTGQAGRDYARDAYAKYRDLNAYDVYTGQDAVIEKVMKSQEKHRSVREYHISKTREASDPFSDYRD